MILIVFDLDFTLWNAGGTWCDHTFPPYRKKNDQVYDSNNSKIFLYPEAEEILCELHKKNMQLAVASRTHEPMWALDLMELFNIKRFFDYFEIYPGSKVAHFENLKKKTGFEYKDMVFFDDETRNVEEVASLGVKVCHVADGLTRKLVMNKLAQ